MKNPIFFLALLGLAASLVACEGRNNSPLPGDWAVQRIYPSGEDEIAVPAAYPLSLEEEGDFSIMLDVNRCGVSYSRSGAGKVEFEYPSCTKTCCDSPLAEQVLGLILQANTYLVNGTLLTLSGPEGKVELEKI